MDDAASLAESEGMYAVSIEVRHDCPVGNISRKLSGLRIVHWCANRRDMFQVSGPRDQIGAFREWVERDFGAHLVSTTAEGILMITSACGCGPSDGRSVGSAVRASGAWDVPPIVYREGWESWRLLVWNERILREMFRRIRELGELRIQSLRPIENVPMEKMMLVPASDIFGGLTVRQSTALLLGLRHGYYGLPSETSIDRLAEGIGLSPSTFSEHLRKAEARILLNLRPHLEAIATRAPGEVAVEEVRIPMGSRGRSASVPASGA